MPAVADARVRPAARVRGRLRVPGDKSISHRYALFAALAEGDSRIDGYSTGADCAATLDCLRALGVAIDQRAGDQGLRLSITGRGLRGLQAPPDALDARNSGTTLRLLSGILSAHRFESIITGDESLRRRPMRRVIEPLSRMGARITAEGDRPPLTIAGGDLSPIDYAPPVPSAQVKSAVLLAGLQTTGTTIVREPAPTRDHTELALRAFGAELESSAGAIAIRGGRPLHALEGRVPGDVSSTTFWAVAAAGLPGSEVEITGVGLNPSRTALYDVLRRAGAHVDIDVERVEHGEPVGRVRVRHGELATLRIEPSEVPAVIDELPALAALATFGGELHVSGAEELRVKESDRISALAAGLRGLGAEIEEFRDGFHIRGTRRLTGGEAHAAHDHRLAMAFAIAALGASGPSVITGAEAVAVSYPGFFETLAQITGEGGEGRPRRIHGGRQDHPRPGARAAARLARRRH
jgi:3-phosphoshikimate 1-carboxyvinyltransferase